MIYVVAYYDPEMPDERGEPGTWVRAKIGVPEPLTEDVLEALRKSAPRGRTCVVREVVR
jgi:hypothetical protein